MSRKSDKIKSGRDPRQLDMFQMLEGVTINGVPIDDISPADFSLIDLAVADISRVVEPNRGATRAQPLGDRRYRQSTGAELPEDAPGQTAHGIHDREVGGEDLPAPDHDHEDLELPDD